MGYLTRQSTIARLDEPVHVMVWIKQFRVTDPHRKNAEDEVRFAAFFSD